MAENWDMGKCVMQVWRFIGWGGDLAGFIVFLYTSGIAFRDINNKNVTYLFCRFSLSC